MHSISSLSPLNTILELDEPDGMRKVGLLSSTGASIFTHTRTQNHMSDESDCKGKEMSTSYARGQISSFSITTLPSPHKLENWNVYWSAIYVHDVTLSQTNSHNLDFNFF